MSNSPALTHKMDVGYIDNKLVGSKKKKKASLSLSEDAVFFYDQTQRNGQQRNKPDVEEGWWLFLVSEVK